MQQPDIVEDVRIPFLDRRSVWGYSGDGRQCAVLLTSRKLCFHSSVAFPAFPATCKQGQLCHWFPRSAPLLTWCRRGMECPSRAAREWVQQYAAFHLIRVFSSEHSEYSKKKCYLIYRAFGKYLKHLKFSKSCYSLILKWTLLFSSKSMPHNDKSKKVCLKSL